MNDISKVADEATATKGLNTVRGRLAQDAARMLEASDALRDLILYHRPRGFITVPDMADAVGRNRNYIDTVWSLFGSEKAAPGNQLRAHAPVDPDKRQKAYEDLANAAAELKRASNATATTRAERDQMITVVYAAKIMGPSAIAREVGIDRNHVLRIARKAGIAPVHRTESKNQYTAK